MADKKFLIKAAECHLGVSLPEQNWNVDIEGLDDVDNFLKTENVVTLYATESNRKVLFYPEIDNLNTNNKIVVFCKTKPLSILNGDNVVSNIQISSICGPPILALYQSLGAIFSPLLAQQNQANVQRQIANLQADLRSALLSSDDQELEASLNSLNVIDSLENEVEYWNNVANTSKTRTTRTAAASFRDILKPLATEFIVSDVLHLNEVEDILENAHNILDDLWRHEPPYPKERIIHLMDVIGDEVMTCMNRQILKHDIWGEIYNNVAQLLTECISVGDRWLNSCKQLTEIFWPNYTLNMWKKEPYQPNDLKKFVERVQNVMVILTLHRQMTRLLTSQEQETLKSNEIFQPFRALNIAELGQFSTNLWIKAQKQFEYLLSPIEERVGLKLQKQLSAVDANIRQLLHEFTRYSELISRPILRKILLSERQHLLTSLFDYVKQLQLESSAENAILLIKNDTPKVVAEIIVLKQVEAKAQEVQKTSEKLLNDLPNYQNLSEIIAEFLKDLKQQHTELFESWVNEISILIKNQSLSLKESEPVVKFSENKLMTVNYSPRLVGLISEVRQFKALCYHIPSHIEQTSKHAQKFMTLARSLEQIANFHNTIGDRMIICQRPMLLASALELSKFVQQKVVSWNDTKSVEKYVESLKSTVEKLSKENNLLASYHYQILDKIQMLDDVDLIKDYSKWKEITRQIRDILMKVEEKGFINMHSWKTEIDSKLCEVLEKQYIMSLDTLHLYLPEIYTNIIYRSEHLEFSPDETVLKEKYQQQLQRFLDIPKNFRGVVDDKNVFAEILQRNSSGLDKVHKQALDLFQQLQDVLKHWQSWLQLDPLDVTKLQVWQHWELHFRASKTFGQEIAKLPNTEERVGCFLVGLTRLRSDLELHNRSYWDQLVISLKDSIAQDVVKLQNFIDPATATLTRQPVTMEEIGETGASHANISKQGPEMEECFSQMIQKSKILASWAHEVVDSVNRVKGSWERLQSLLANHQHIIAKQMETIKTTLNIETENLEKEMERFAAKWDQIKPKVNTGQIADQTIDELYKQLEGMREKKTQWIEVLAKKNKLLSDFEKFNIDKPKFEVEEEIERDLNKEEDSWTLFGQFYLELGSLAKEEWIVFRKKIFKFEDFLSDWQVKLKSQNNNDLITRILQEIHKMEEVSPSLKFVRGEDFTEKHWMDVFNLLELPTKPLDHLVFKDFLSVSEKLISNTKQLQTLCKRAASEIVVRQVLAELDQWEVQARFILAPHKDSRKANILLIKDFKDILNKIGDNQSLLQSVKNAADYDSFSERASLWENKLSKLEQNLTLLAQIQRKWIYLEPIFGSGTLVQERARFEKIDKDFHHLLVFIEKDPRVSAIYRYPNLNSILKNLQEQLGRCQKSLENFLAEKRSRFPRFLFLGDDDLLEVVGQSSKEQVIQTHLKKLFAGINNIQMDEDGKNIVAMCSSQGEVVPLTTPINVEQQVEDWLNILVKEMQKTMKELLIQCLGEGQNADPLKYPSQILCLADNITFTAKMEQAIGSMTLPPLLAYYKAQLQHYSSLELNANEEKTYASLNLGASEDTNILELKLNALLLDMIHHIDVIEELMNANIMKITDWVWQKQLRFYSNTSGEVTIKMANSRMEYAYEYLGNAAKLVRTPLTDRCFLTLTQGMHLGMGGNPYGPAGTGKTESVKALGSLLGRQVLVFNCDEGIDATAMGRILSGLVRSGAWGCFDEFNRLDEATLSAVSMQIQPIQNALRTHQDKLVLMDQEIQVNRHCGIFVTLNPAGGSYGGRNKLPDNLKQLFRPVVMTHPDQEQITRTLLRCCGYQNAELIGKKLIEVFESSSKLLSKQQHYDWGLRAIRTVLSGCSRILKQFIKTHEEPLTLINELNLIVQVLRTDTMSKLTFSDSIKFDSIIRDVFKGIELAEVGHEGLIKIIQDVYQNSNYTINDRQVNKCLELYEQLKQRMGVVIVGPPSSGKSTIRNILFHALSKIGKLVRQHAFNPRSMQKTELLGQIDLDTRQWNDGVLTLYSLQVTSEPQDVWSWVVCDGNIDPEWVEALNSVLDDNRLLTLPSGWRIQFGPNVNFIFETHDLSFASPATISRMGIVFLDEKDLKVTDYLSSYLRQEPEDSILSSYINDYFIRAVDWVIKEGDITVPCSKLAMVKIGLSQVANIRTKSQFTVALANGLGQLLQDDFREIFAQQIFEWIGEMAPPIILKARYNQERDFIDSYFTNPNVSINLIDGKIPLVMTGDVAQTIDNLRVWILSGNEQHFLLIGPHGSAKTLIIENLVKDRTDVELATIYCSANLMPRHVLSKLSQNCITVNTNKGKLYKPKKGHLVLYFKNMHLLKPDKYGTNILIEFLHQLITYRAFFDANLEMVHVDNVTIVGSLIATNILSTRFTSIVNIYNINLPDQEDLSIIIVAYLSAIFSQCSLPTNWSKPKIVKLASAILATYDQMRSVFVVTQYIHYAFSPHDLISWCASILRYDLTSDSNENTLVQILCYEAMKQFGDKLVNEDDKVKLRQILLETFSTQWNITAFFKTTWKNCYYIPSSYNFNPKLDFWEKSDWENYVLKGITQYSREGEELDIIVNDELLELASSIYKVLSNPGGNVVLVGKSGCGRKSAVKIITALHSAKLITLFSDNQPQFNNDLKQALQSSSLDDQEVYMLLEDQMLNKNSILNLINILIAAGEIPGLYNSAEIDTMTAGLKDEASRENFEGDLMAFLTQKTKRRLHVVACIDVDNDNIWKIFENCPALLYSSTIIWKSQWNNNTIQEIPAKLIARFNKKHPLREVEVCAKFPKMFDIIHFKMAAPSKYISMIKHYIDLYLEKQETTLKRQTKLSAGVSKLVAAQNLVTQLKQKAAEQQEKLAEKQAKANNALDMISRTMQNANTHKEEMESLKSKTEEENHLLINRKKEIEQELAEVEPLIQEARSAVGNIKAEALSEIRSLRAPPEIIRDILEGVLRLMGINDTSWNSMKTFLAKRGVKEEIRSFDASRIGTESRQAVERLMANKKDSFDPKMAKRASVAAAPLAAWVIANVKYSHVHDKIRPLEREQHKLQENLADAESQLGKLSAGLLDVDARVTELKNQLSAYTKEAAEIEIDLNKAEATLAAAEGLVGKLEEEFHRWQAQLKELSEQLNKLSDNCCLSAAFITYLSDSSEDERRKILVKWTDAVVIDGFNFEEFLTSEREQLQWQTEGLPLDKLSIQNAIIITKAKITPLIIDPTSSAVTWLKNNLKNRQIESITQNSPKFSNNLELAIRFGKVLFIEEIETISANLLPILRQEFIYQGERKLVNFHGKLVDYHSDFKLILCSRNEQLRIPADMSAIISIMNFSVTRAGLTEQLLSCAIRQENPELEDRRKDLLRTREELQEKQENLQNQLLEDLANSSGDILQNANLLKSLNETKTSSIAINQALEESILIQNKLQLECEAYHTISEFGSALYFACNEFSSFNVLYALSVSAFVKLFLNSLETFQAIAASSLDLQKKHLFETVYAFISQGIFKNDRIIFALHLMQKLYGIPKEEWKLFLNNSVTGQNLVENENVLTWIPQQCLGNVSNLQASLPTLFHDLKLEEPSLWNRFMSTKMCEKEFPSHCKLTDFQKVLVVQAIRPDRCYSALDQCVLHITGLRSIDPVVIDLNQIFKESQFQNPILLLTVSGTDPSAEIRSLAHTLNTECLEVAMGEGQETKAIYALQKVAQTNQWLVLKNLHLVTDWLPLLCQNLQTVQKHNDFRLWLITEPNPKFNFVLAQNSLKFVYEAPQGLRNNILRTYNTWGAKYFEKLTASSARIFLVLSCIHALLQERRTYIPQGWSKWYEFSDTDLSTAIRLVEDLWQNNASQVPWKYIFGLCYDAIYGGRIENIDDMDILKTYLKQYLNDDVLSHRWMIFDQKISFPTSNRFLDYVNALKQLPDRDLPIYFGLPENIDRAWEKQTTLDIISKLKGFTISKQLPYNFDREFWHKTLAPYLNLWKKINHGHDFIRMPIPELILSESSISSFISEEYRGAISLIQKIHRNFANLNKICKGIMLPDNDDVVVANSLMNLEVPKIWKLIWDGPLDPQTYLKQLLTKTQSISQRSESINLSSLLHPEAFLASYKQEYSRLNNIPMDELELESKWKTSSNKNYMVLKNLLIEGGLFDGYNLKACAAHSENINQAPNCYITWTKTAKISEEGILQVPLYYTSSREKQLTSLHIICDEKQKDRWIQAGLAFYLEY